MATPVVIRHPFQSLKADGPDPTLVRPSNWNANHVMTGGADGQMLIFDSSSATGLSFANQVTASLTNQTGGTLAVGDVVAVSLAADSVVILSDVLSSALQFAVSLGTPANAAAGTFGVRGPIPGVKAQGAIPAGNYVRKSATTKAVEDTGVLAAAATPPPAGALGFATTPAAAGVVSVWWFGVTTVVVAPPAAAIYTDELTGLGLTFTSTTAVTVAAGAAASDDATLSSRALMVLASSIQGTTAGTWVVGNNQPKLDAGTVGNNQTWHVYEIQRPDTGVVDVLFSQSATAPTLPTNYTKKRRLGAVLTSGAAAILSFSQDADEFLLSTALLDVNVTNPGTSAVLRALTVPTGVKVRAILNAYLKSATSGNLLQSLYLSSPDVSDQAADPSGAAAPLSTFQPASAGNGFPGTIGPLAIRTNTSAQIRTRVGTNSGASDVLAIATLGWFDRRGKGV